MHPDSGEARRPTRARLGGRRRVALVVVAVLVGIVVLAQLVLPGIAAKRARERVERYGTVTAVNVSAFPALELLWGDMDKLSVRASRMHVALGQIGDLLWSARGSEELDFSSSQTRLLSAGFTNGALTLTDVDLRKHGSALNSQATVREADLRAALPKGFEIQPVASGSGAVEVRASGALFGVQAAIEAVITAAEGKLVVEPTSLPLGGLLRLTLFSDPRIFIQGIAASSQPGGYRFTITARLR